MWKYKDTYVNNGSTLLSDIDMRHYYYIERDVGPGTSTDIDPTHKKSELFLAATRFAKRKFSKVKAISEMTCFIYSSIDDNGTFSCIAENKAGIAKAEFTLHVVVPVPPKPPQVSRTIIEFFYLYLFILNEAKQSIKSLSAIDFGLLDQTDKCKIAIARKLK